MVSASEGGRVDRGRCGGRCNGVSRDDMCGGDAPSDTAFLEYWNKENYYIAALRLLCHRFFEISTHITYY